MASVISSSMLEDSAQADGRRYVRYQYVLSDNNSVQHTIAFDRGLVESGFDADADRISRGSDILESYAASEDEAAKTASDALTITLNPQWSTSKRIAKLLIRWMLRERDPRIVIWLEPLIIYLRANYTATQLANFLDVTTTQLQTINQKINRILDPPATITSGKELINLYIGSSEDIG